MPYDQTLAQRIHAVLQTHPEIIEKKMFGGVGFILHGNMACGVQGNDLIVRVGAENNESTLSLPYTRPFMARPGMPMAGWVLVSPEGTKDDPDLQEWIERGYAYAYSLPKKG